MVTRHLGHVIAQLSPLSYTNRKSLLRCSVCH
ncbi:Uncharacterised protein [Vibrio cholerae]|nr:Uncharacterised protein [Vibrio cholerae]